MVLVRNLGSSEIPNTTSIVLEIGQFYKATTSKICHFQCNKRVKFHYTYIIMLFKVNTILADLRILASSVYAIYHCVIANTILLVYIVEIWK